MDVFIANGNRYNLLNSAVLDLLEHIRKGNATLLLKYIVDTFWDQLAPFQCLASIQAFMLKYEQCLETAGPKSTADAVDPRRRVEERALDKEEEDYFNEESDEEDSASASNTQKEKPASNTEKDQAEPHLSNGVDASPSSSSSMRSGGLVDYEDDEDDEDYKPPPLRQPEEGEDELLSLKRKSPLVEREQEPSRKPRLGKRENVFTVLCSTLSHAVRTGKKSQGTSESAAKEPEESRSSEENTRSSSNDESHKEDDGVACREHGTSSDNGKLNAEESVVVAQKSSPEMAVNGRAATL
ncbi:hypothetical protein F2Q69_00032279 [Brassica cretica]|uniref:Serine/threonine-protein phosphatase 4 regulatory subunit 3-like central domain-containing protein n=1 Tax=Brassica cretica TaxID=69181 RepID=A0A8S9RX65_BRACR|nr:hypothetical protein F2Q69_00032279 [Brassica cretica]